MKHLPLSTNWILLFALLTSAPLLSAQCLESEGKLYNVDGTDCTNNIVSAVPFLRIVADARSGAMGDVGLAISSDANAIHFNASKLAFADSDMAFSATYTSWFPTLGVKDVYLGYLTGYKKIGERQTLGLGLRYFSLGDLQFVDSRGIALNTDAPREFEVAIAYARSLSKRLSLGITGKLISSNLAAGLQLPWGRIISPQTTGAADISIIYKMPVNIVRWKSGLQLGLALSNLGSKISYSRNAIDKDYLPANLGLGAAWEIQFDTYNSLTIAADLNKLMVPTPCPVPTRSACDRNGNGRSDFREQSVISGIFNSFSDAPAGSNEELRELMYATGLEYWYKKQYALRVGYFHENGTKGGRQYYTTGLGFKNRLFGVNFSYLIPANNQRNPIDNTLRISLLFNLEAKETLP